MINPRFFPAFLLGLTLLFSVSNTFGQNIESFIPSLSNELRPIRSFDSTTKGLIPKARVKFSNPAVKKFEDGCTQANLNRNRFAGGISESQRLSFCQAFQTVSNELNNTSWSPKLQSELQEIWQVFMNENVKIRPMRRGIPRQIALAAEPFTRGGGGYGFNASVYIRPKFADKKVFFLLAMHELRHIYDFYKLWETSSALPEGELEKRGFRIMGRIARETKEKEKFKRLPKLWKDSWAMQAQSKIDSRMEKTIEKFMKRSSFYKQRLKHPNRFMISFVGRRRAYDQSQMASNREPKTRRSGKALNNSSAAVAVADRKFTPPKLVRKKTPAKIDTTAKSNNIASLKVSKNSIRLPDPIMTKPLKASVESAKLRAPFVVTKARNRKSSEDLLSAAISNERSLYRKMDKFLYDEDFQLQCWKKQKIADRYSRKRTVGRTVQGKPVFQNEAILRVFKKKKAHQPSCLINFDAIDSDATETFWSAGYLKDMPIKFDYFTMLNGEKVARYTVYKPAKKKFEQIAAKYPHIKSFRVFVGSIFVSVKDSQIVKFWGSSFPERDTTGNRTNKTLANYNATATRQRLESGIWVTTALDTVAIAKKRGKMKPFRYSVKYKNYREATGKK